ncbi:MAG: response regulator [Candidatus Latescibacteria bacterium]|nr:response regulator [Candidatus Latescibacterota bacterium]
MSKILIVDDEEDIRSLLKRFLTKKEYDVTTASDGYQVLIKVKEWEPDIVLLDILMPGISGMEVLPLIKEINEKIGIIMITAVRDVETGRKALSMGADDYITKPFDLNYLETSVMAKILMIESGY